MNIALPEQSQLFADSAYTDYELEDLYAECEAVALMVERKSNPKEMIHSLSNTSRNGCVRELKLLSVAYMLTFLSPSMRLLLKDSY